MNDQDKLEKYWRNKDDRWKDKKITTTRNAYGIVPTVSNEKMKLKILTWKLFGECEKIEVAIEGS